VGVQAGKTTLLVADIEEGDADLIKKLLLRRPDEILKILNSLEPEVLDTLSFLRIQKQREKILKEFEEALTQSKDEAFWQNFFEQNEWIFGYGLRYQILKPIAEQPHYGGGGVTEHKTGQVGDYLTHTEGEKRFTVLVEIKTPQTPLVQSYRTDVWGVGKEVSGGVSQLQVHCRTWDHERSKSQKIQEDLLQKQIFTIDPRGILVIGHTQNLETVEKRSSFELFRRNLHNPEIVTFDELYERAKYIVQHGSIEKDIIIEDVSF
jgi:hypothetical protein